MHWVDWFILWKFVTFESNLAQVLCEKSNHESLELTSICPLISYLWSKKASFWGSKSPRVIKSSTTKPIVWQPHYILLLYSIKIIDWIECKKILWAFFCNQNLCLEGDSNPQKIKFLSTRPDTVTTRPRWTTHNMLKN